MTRSTSQIRKAARRLVVPGLLVALDGLSTAALAATNSPALPLPHRAASPWPIFTGIVAVAAVLAMAWMQIRHRRRVEESNAELRRSELEARRAFEALRESESKFRLLFERTADALLLFDPAAGRIVECNDAAIKLSRAPSRDWLLAPPGGRLFPDTQPDGIPSLQKLTDMIDLAILHGSHQFDWTAQDPAGQPFIMDVLLTPVQVEGRQLILSVARDITGRKQAEEEIRRVNQSLEQLVAERTAELKASEARLRTLLEHAPDAIVVLDADTGHMESCNENAVRLFGLAAETIRQKSPADLSPPVQPDGRPSPEAARDYIQQAVNGGTPVFNWTHRRADGRLIPCEIRLVRLPSSEGRRLVRGSIVDNSERQRREQIQAATYRISEAIHTTDDLDSLYEQIHRIIGDLMPARNFYIALFDAPTETISFPYYVDEFHSTRPEPRKLTTGLTGWVLRTGKPLLLDRTTASQKRQVGNAVVVEALGNIPYVESGRPAAIWLGVPLRFQGRTIGAMALQDYDDDKAYGEQEKQILTFVAEQTALAIERKRAEQALRESEEKHRALFEATSQGVMLHDEDQFLEVNPAAVRILGFTSADQIVGKHPAETSAPLQSGGQPAGPLARQHVQECLRKGSTRFEWITRTPQGVDIPLEVTLTRIPMGSRQLIQAVIQDISERKKAETELLRSLAREKELGALKSRFVSTVSHEFRTPLAIILSSAEILDEYFDRLQPEERREQLRSIQTNSRRMAHLMEEVLLLGQAEAGRLDFRPDPLHLPRFCRRLIEEVTAATGSASPIDLVLDPSLTEVAADERLLRHILINLLSNAVKYSPHGQPVTFTVRRDDQQIVCQVRDQGIGIPEADREWIFQPFHRGANTGQIPGTGLGLSIVKRCVELHGGSIRIDSQVGSGTTITVRIPAPPVTPESQEPPAPPTPATPASPIP